MKIYIQKSTAYQKHFKEREKRQNNFVSTNTYVEWCELFIFLKPTSCGF